MTPWSAARRPGWAGDPGREPVPDGFCVTTEAAGSGVSPQARGVAPRATSGSARARWRSAPAPRPRTCPAPASPGSRTPSSTSPGADELIAAIEQCWGSLRGERAIAYRDGRRHRHHAVRMAVVVQRMIDPGWPE